MGRIVVRKMTNAHDDFYFLLGPFLSRRDIVKEVGGPIWDDPEKVWFLALDRKHVLGFCALHKQQLCSVYVIREARSRGIGRALIEEAIASAATPLSIVAVKSSEKFYAKLGFKKSKEGKGYVWMQRLVG